ncbi:alpha-ketoglutarate-dependent dioxygenase AlkB [Marinicauda sp. Alg238-R41]|uniref:alpha-ketoglutarate-dependent dioxygenase AlkB n=1 Tax=Marinicauda sp. Alg238-R41 TaxID=2993447 RepID=UPI0022E94DDF|nr:alpha-ketoglutarate-dependent dioxygenase AlkB [Marinicauda sp. Alg238-R41]
MQRDDGFTLHKTYLDRAAQTGLVDAVLSRVGRSPLYTPSMPRSGKPMSVRMTNFGPLGWVTDKAQGYRYQTTHPVTHEPWPDMPQVLIDIWQAVAGWEALPQACLVNWYGEGARLGQHVDADEAARDAPVVSISLGDSAKFRLGGPALKDASTSMRLDSGDVVVLAGASRRFRHGVDRILPGTSSLLPEDWRPGRLNLTLRRVN